MEPTNNLKLQVNSGLFNNDTYYITHKKLYYAYFQEIPDIAHVDKINTKAFKQWVERELKNQILHLHTKETYATGIKSPVLSNYIYILHNKILIDIDTTEAAVLYNKEFEKEARMIINTARTFKRKCEVKSHIHVVTNQHGNWNLKPLKCRKYKTSLYENYNDDLIELDKKIIHTVCEKDRGGLYLFHGNPGTGKTSYIRSLIHRLKKNIIFLPVQIAENIDSPDLLILLLDNPGSILVIEDAERLLVARDTGNNSGISAILNMTDGLVADGLGIKIICTFNTHLSNIDKALLRKGRLKALYEFKPLELSKTKTLLEKIGIQNPIVNEPMTLADIYNFKEQSTLTNISERNPIGFANKVA